MPPTPLDRTPIDPAHRRSGIPLIAEPVLPWLAGAFALAVLQLGLTLTGRLVTVLDQALLLIPICALLAAGGLVASRSSRRLDAINVKERARPATDELAGSDLSVTPAPYVTGMARWTGAVLDLIQNAIATEEPDEAGRARLVTAAADTGALHAYLSAQDPEDLGINDAATIHALCTLWEVDAAQVEQLAARADRDWYRRWCARVVPDRALRHGTTSRPAMVLPYRD